MPYLADICGSDASRFDPCGIEHFLSCDTFMHDIALALNLLRPPTLDNILGFRFGNAGLAIQVWQ